jgi:hypothetical protein
MLRPYDTSHGVSYELQILSPPPVRRDAREGVQNPGVEPGLLL